MKCSKCAREQTAVSEDFGIFDYRITATGGNYVMEDVKLLGIVRTCLCSSCIQSLHNESTKVDGELKIGRIILLGLLFLVAAIVAGALDQGAVAGVLGVSGVGAVIFQLKTAKEHKAANKRKEQAFQAAKAGGFQGVSIVDFINDSELEHSGSETIVNCEQVAVMRKLGMDAGAIAASAEASVPLPSKSGGRFRRYITAEKLDAACTEFLHKPLDAIVEDVYRIKKSQME